MISKRLDKSLSALIKEADEHFRRYIQKRDEGKPCFICELPIWKGQAEVCHYIKRADLPVRWNEFNGHLGCMTCNRFDQEHEDAYASRIMRTYGIEKLQELEQLGRSLMKPMRHELLELIDTYKQKLKELR